MNMKIINRLLMIASIGLLIAGIVFIVFCLLGEKDMLVWALLCVCVSNLFNIIKTNINKNDK